MHWLISIPVWGAPYVATFARCAAPALLAAAARLPEPVRFLLHTDAPDAVRAALPGQDVEVRHVSGKPTYAALQEGHADAVRAATPGDRVVLLNADLVVSGNFLVRCAEHLGAGSQAVVLLGIRTVMGDVPPPPGAAPRDLLAWAWGHRHQIIRDLEWPQGGSMLPTNLFWSTTQDTVARGFHLHPAAIVKQENTTFRSTIDGDLLDCFARDKIHVVVDADDCAMCEVSAPERRFPVRGQHFTPAHVAGAMRSRASPTHRWLFEHRILVRGTRAGISEDGPVAEAILRLLAAPAPPAPSPAPRRGIPTPPAPPPAPPRRIVRPGRRRGRVPSS
jgi:hypothetical protein